jgi:hypothetical protein
LTDYQSTALGTLQGLRPREARLILEEELAGTAFLSSALLLFDVMRTL